MKKIMLCVMCIGAFISFEGYAILSESDNMNTYSDALFQTIKEQDYNKFRELLPETGDLNLPRSNKKIPRSVDFENIYPLEAACFASAQMTYDLLEHVDANPNTALNLSVIVFEDEPEETYRRSIEVLSYLLEHCSLDLVMKKSNNNPLRAAAMCNNCMAIEYLLTQGYFDADTSWHEFTPLMNAAILQKKEACKLLLEYGADKDLVSPEGKTAYEYAAEKITQN